MVFGPRKGEVRPPALAGTWYPAEPTALSASIVGYLEQATSESQRPHRTPRALIVPHAGHIYSGATAAHAFIEVQEAPKRIILIGPAHRLGFSGISAGDFSHYQCPLGNVVVDRKAVADLVRRGLVHPVIDAHRDEHCLEIMLPFILERFGQVPILPLLVGSARPGDVVRVLDAAYEDGDLALISSDLSHFLTYDEARARDLNTLQSIIEGRWQHLRGDDACGHIAIGGLIQFAERRGWEPTLLDYRNSGDTAGDRQRVVGYGALAYYGADSG